jgi:predicted PurR-regulated permease PerM
MTITTSSIIKKLLVLFLVFAALYFAKNFLMPLAIGGVLATIFLPLTSWLESKKVPKIISALICLLLLLIAIAGIGSLLGWQIYELSNDFEIIKLKSIQLTGQIQIIIFNNLGIPIEKQSQFLGNQQPFIRDVIQEMATSLSSIFTYSILILVYVLFLLYYRNHIKNFLLKLSPPSQREEMQNVIYSVTKVSQQYLLGLSKMIVCLWFMYGIGFSVLGVKNAIFFAVLCGLLEIIPFIGNITGIIITIFVAVVQGVGFPVVLGIMGIYGIVQFIQGWVLEPLIVGSHVKINPLFTIIALVIGELVWGLIGIFLAIPLMAMFKIVCDHIDTLKPYGYLIGSIESKKKVPAFIKKLK